MRRVQRCCGRLSSGLRGKLSISVRFEQWSAYLLSLQRATAAEGGGEGEEAAGQANVVSGSSSSFCRTAVTVTRTGALPCSIQKNEQSAHSNRWHRRLHGAAGKWTRSPRLYLWRWLSGSAGHRSMEGEQQDALPLVGRWWWWWWWLKVELLY